MNDVAKINKMLEAAVVCAAQDGLDDNEIAQVMGAIMVVPMMGQSIQDSMAANDIETDDVDLSFESAIEAFTEFVSNLHSNLERYELIEVDDKYAEEVAGVLGNSAALQNLCIGIALALSAGDGEISSIESGAFELLASKMNLVMGSVCELIANTVLEAAAESAE